jgi:uncharacterized protein (DUF2267 family)
MDPLRTCAEREHPPFAGRWWRAAGTPLRERHRDEFLAFLAPPFTGEAPIDSELITRAVVRLLARHVTAGEIEGIKHALAGELRSLWH